MISIAGRDVSGNTGKTYVGLAERGTDSEIVCGQDNLYQGIFICGRVLVDSEGQQDNENAECDGHKSGDGEPEAVHRCSPEQSG